MFIGTYKISGEDFFAIYFKNKRGYIAWQEDTFSPLTECIEILDFKISGSDYRERQASLEDLAKEWQLYFCDYDWSYGELATIQTWFYKNAKRYGLLEEFRVNGIC